MPKTYYPLIACILLIASFSRCHHADFSKTPPVFKPDNLTPFYAEVDITRDTTLHTPEGSLIHIPAHALDAGGAPKVRLVIREALRMSDIIRAGLLTTSYGKPLTSGGMIDIEPAEGQTVTITKPLSVSLHTPFFNKDMQLYKGLKGPDGNLNWKDPEPLADSPQIARLHRGQAMFNLNCAACHSTRLDKTLTGPGLAYIYQRRDKQWLFAFTHNNQIVLRAGDRYANCLYNQYNKTPMNTFPDLTDADLEELYHYIDNESYRQGLPFPDDRLKHCADSCDALEKPAVLQQRRRAWLTAKGPAKISGPAMVSPPAPVPAPVPDTPREGSTEYYEFTIQGFGWYNMDALLHYYGGGDAVQPCEIMARIQPEYQDSVTLYLGVPSRHVLQQGHPQVRDSIFVFNEFEKGADFPLPWGVQCFILAIGEKNGTPLIGYSEFSTTDRQTINLDIRTTTKEQLKEYFRRLDVPDTARQTYGSREDTKCNCNCSAQPVQQ